MEDFLEKSPFFFLTIFQNTFCCLFESFYFFLPSFAYPCRPVPEPGPRFVFRGPGADLQGRSASDDVGDDVGCGLDDGTSGVGALGLRWSGMSRKKRLRIRNLKKTQEDQEIR